MDKASACIFYMVGTEEKDKWDIEESLTHLYHFFNKKYQYDVVIFHENWTKDYCGRLAERYQGTTFRFVEMTPIIPEGVFKRVIGSSPGYRAMCRYMSGPIFQEELLGRYKWMWHQDADSRLMGPVNYDPFLWMEKHNKKYGFQCLMKEQDFACTGFWETTQKFIHENKVEPKSLAKHLDGNGDWNLDYYYSDFAILDMDFFRSKQYIDYFIALDEADLFFRYRVGDTLVCSMGVFLFMPEKETHQFKDIRWLHQAYVNI